MMILKLHYIWVSYPFDQGCNFRRYLIAAAEVGEAERSDHQERFEIAKTGAFTCIICFTEWLDEEKVPLTAQKAPSSVAPPDGATI